MVKIKLSPNESVQIELDGADGKFQFTYGKKQVSVFAEMPDTKGRKGTIYLERFNDPNPIPPAGADLSAAQGAPVAAEQSQSASAAG